MLRRLHLSPTLLPLAAVLLPLAEVRGQTVTVTTSSNVVDIPFTGRIKDLPGPDGRVSFREATLVTNNEPGHQTVGFAIPRSEWQLQNLFPGRAVLRGTARFSDSVTLDGRTQTAFTGNTNPNGAEVLVFGGTVFLNAASCAMLGFDGTIVSVNGSGGRIQDNTGQMGIKVFSGSGCLIKNNAARSISITRSNQNIVVGNRVVSMQLLGWPTALASGNRIGGPNPSDRNHIQGEGSYNSAGRPSGTALRIAYTKGTVVENNRIGTSPDGMGSGHRATTIGVGLELQNSDFLLRSNHIAGVLGQGIGRFAGRFFGDAVKIDGSGSGITLVGNRIGVDAKGKPVLGSVHGINVGLVSQTVPRLVRIGGTAAGEGNVIAGHRTSGVTVGRRVQDARISGNSIHDNAGLGIDLVPTVGGFGVTPNDRLDADSGGNGLQNFPEIGIAAAGAGFTRVRSKLHSQPGSSFRVEFFASPECDPTGFGEGKRFLGSVAVSTNAAGDVSFDARLPQVPPGWFVTSTATLQTVGATSEFSRCAKVRPAAGVKSIGTGCRGPAPTPLAIRANGKPVVPNPGFALVMSGGPTNAASVFFLALSLLPVRRSLGSCWIYIDPATILGGFPPSPSRVLALPLPADPRLIGLELNAQGLAVTSPTSFATSNALTLQFGL